MADEPRPGYKFIYTPYITRKGKRVFRKDGKVWRIEVLI